MRAFLRTVSAWLLGLGVINAILGIVALILGDPPTVGWFAFAAVAFVVTALCVDWVEARW